MRTRRKISCQQDIASDGCFSLGLLSEFDLPIAEFGAWSQTRLFWVCGTIGQFLYLEAEVKGLRGTDIGCFLDDLIREVLGLRAITTRTFTISGWVLR